MYQSQALAHQVYIKHKNQIGKKALIIGLEGPLGAGKTMFVKYLAKLLGIKDNIVSPTFILHREYDILDHIDLWRIDDPGEIVALGLGKMVKQNRIIAIEWAEKSRKQILKFQNQASIVWIKLDYGEKEKERKVSYEDIGN